MDKKKTLNFQQLMRMPMRIDKCIKHEPSLCKKCSKRVNKVLKAIEILYNEKSNITAEQRKLY